MQMLAAGCELMLSTGQNATVCIGDEVELCNGYRGTVSAWTDAGVAVRVVNGPVCRLLKVLCFAVGDMDIKAIVRRTPHGKHVEAVMEDRCKRVQEQTAADAAWTTDEVLRREA